MISSEIRHSFLEYFESQGHRVVPSASLVPVDDSTLLFTNAGMNQFKDLFLGKQPSDYRRATSSQKCMRVSGKHNDLNNVGPSLRHHTFFEMLGNFSFGDYFKTDAIPFAWHLLTKTWSIPPERLYATVFGGEGAIPPDREAMEIWRHFLPDNRIAELGLSENFWAMGNTGPCGRCSEVHYHRGDHLPCPEPTCRGVDCSCDRYVEIWNNVFMEFERHADGTMSPLPAPSIDTGMGLERMVAVLQGTVSNYDTDLFVPLLKHISDVTGIGYIPLADGQDEPETNISIRIVADHMRAMTFLIADGVLPSNEWRGYVLRKIMRRAMRHGKKLGMTQPFLNGLVNSLVSQMGETYIQLRSNRDSITQVILSEEERFDTVLNDGLPRLEASMAKAASESRRLDGIEVFRLYDTYGLPLDFIEDLAGERQLTIDQVGFERAMDGQRQKSRSSHAFDRHTDQEWIYLSSQSKQQTQRIEDRFEGYTTTRVNETLVLILFDSDRRQIDELPAGSSGYAILERTPFYVEAGGQVSDTGQLLGVDGTSEAKVTAMEHLQAGDSRVHRVNVVSGALVTGKTVSAEVDAATRNSTRRNHTATHLLHAALRISLGDHVKQAGSLVSPDRLRFDFTHFHPVSGMELAEIEQRINRQIYGNSPVDTTVRSTQEAIAEGATALFGEKYGNEVRVVSVPGISTELCGGTHCRRTGEIGPLVITQESGVSAGVRRIEAFTGDKAITHMQKCITSLDGVLEVMSVPTDQVVDAVERMQTHVKQLARQIEQLKIRAAMDFVTTGDTQNEVTEIEGVTIVRRKVSGLERTSLRALADSIRDRLESGVVVLACENDGKVGLLVSVTKDLTKRIHAGEIIKAIAPVVGGRGGGQADFAEAGGRESSKIEKLFPTSLEVITQMLKDTSQAD